MIERNEAFSVSNCDMKEVSQRHPLPHSSLLRHISVAVNMHTTVEALLEVLFPDLSMTELCKESQ
jgi:hypothetical protein